MSWMSHNPDALDNYIEEFLVENSYQAEVGDWQEQDFQTPAEALEYHRPDDWSNLLAEFEQAYWESRLHFEFN